MRAGDRLALGDGGLWAVPALAGAPGSCAHFEMGALTVDLEVIAAGERPPCRRARLGLGAWVIQGLSAMVLVGLLAMLAMVFPRIGADDVDAEGARDRNVLTEPAPGESGDSRQGGGSGTRALAEEGAEGNPVIPAHGGHVASRATSREVHVTRQADLREASDFGIIGLLAVARGSGSASSPWEPRPGESSDASTARAPLWGGTIADAFSWGGPGLSGTGEGGGGRGEGIAIGTIGTIGGMGGGGRGRLGGSHRVRIREGGDDFLSINGRLPPEIIQRIIRQNMGRFRLCYERALERRPDLAGRVVTRFIVGRDGSVVLAVDAGSDLPDLNVVSCVVRAFQTLSFPEPTGGTVNVVYPLSLTPE